MLGFGSPEHPLYLERLAYTNAWTCFSSCLVLPAAWDRPEGVEGGSAPPEISLSQGARQAVLVPTREGSALRHHLNEGSGILTQLGILSVPGKGTNDCTKPTPIANGRANPTVQLSLNSIMSAPHRLTYWQAVSSFMMPSAFCAMNLGDVFYSAIKQYKIIPFAATWMDQEIITLTEVRQKHLPYDIVYM